MVQWAVVGGRGSCCGNCCQGEGLTVRSRGRFTVGFFVDVVMPGFRDLRIADDVPQL